MKRVLITNSRPIYCALACLLSPVAIMAENISVNGHVKDQTGFPIIGTNIVDQSTNKGGIKEIDRNFEICGCDWAQMGSSEL